MIFLWIILANMTLATLILVVLKIREILTREPKQDEDAFDRDPHPHAYKHARRPEEWEDFPQIKRVPQSGTFYHDVPQSGKPSHKVEHFTTCPISEALKVGRPDWTEWSEPISIAGYADWEMEDLEVLGVSRRGVCKDQESHSRKPKKDRQGKSHIDPYGVRFNARKTLAKIVNEKI